MTKQVGTNKVLRNETQDGEERKIQMIKTNDYNKKKCSLQNITREFAVERNNNKFK